MERTSVLEIMGVKPLVPELLDTIHGPLAEEGRNLFPWCFPLELQSGYWHLSQH